MFFKSSHIKNKWHDFITNLNNNLSKFTCKFSTMIALNDELNHNSLMAGFDEKPSYLYGMTSALSVDDDDDLDDDDDIDDDDLDVDEVDVDEVDDVEVDEDPVIDDADLDDDLDLDEDDDDDDDDTV